MEKMKVVNIIIKGQTGTGKGVLAEIIEQVIFNHGITVSITPETRAEFFSKDEPLVTPESIEYLREKVRVRIGHEQEKFEPASKLIGYRLKMEYPGCNKKEGYFERKTTGEFSKYPAIWEPVYGPA
jgi:hypothetical protein